MTGILKFIFMSIQKQKKINITATIDWLKNCWLEYKEYINTKIGSQGRVSISERRVEMTRFKLMREIKDIMSLALIQHKSMDFYSKDMFSIPFDIFASTAIHFGLEYADIAVLQHYYTAFYIKKRKKKNTKVPRKGLCVRLKDF